MPYKCRYCNKTIEEEERLRNDDVGLSIARKASLCSVGHTDYVQAYIICDSCAEEYEDLDY